MAHTSDPSFSTQSEQLPQNGAHEPGAGVLAAHTEHPRTYHENKFVYPVLSRRSHGISLGINLNPDKVCNFDCIYCQVDRRTAAVTTFVETGRLLAELERTLDLVASGALYDDPPFDHVPEALAPAQRHRLLRRRRADHLPELRPDRRGRGRDQAAAGPRHGQDGPDHQRQHVPPRPRAAGPRHVRPQQRRDLGQARRRHRAVLPSDRPDDRSPSTASSATSSDAARHTSPGHPEPVHEGRGRRALRRRDRRLLRPI